jgi:hypothetical protein
MHCSITFVVSGCESQLLGSGSRFINAVQEREMCLESVAYRGGLGGSTPPPPAPKFLSFDKAEPNSQFHGKYIRNSLMRIRVSLICKLSGTPVRGYHPQIPILSALCTQLNMLNPPPKKFLGTLLFRILSALRNLRFVNRCLRQILRIWWPKIISNKDLWKATG